MFSISGIYALTNDVINNTESTISTSYVDIKLEQYQNDESYTKENEVVVPGEVIPLNTKINNLGINCYVRAKITYTLNNTEYIESNYINGDYKNWTRKDDYYYYDSVLNQSEVIDLFDTIQIPNEIINESLGDKLIVHILVEAVQAKNFDGNWNEVDIKEAVDRSYSMDSDGKSEIIYENNADKYIDIGDGFFNNLGGLLPGDSIEDQITIDNNSHNKIKYYLSIDTKNLSHFMNVMGMTSSIVDVLAFIGFWYGFNYRVDTYFQTAWFVFCLVSEAMIVYFIRTSKTPFIESINFNDSSSFTPLFSILPSKYLIPIEIVL